jgi:putative endonuclease
MSHQAHIPADLLMFIARSKCPCVYILASKPNGVLYTGVTSDLWSRMYDHVTGAFEGFTKKYGVKTLVYYEMHDTMDAAIRREKRIKEWQRAWKVRLINSFNPEWRDMYDFATGEIASGPADDQRIIDRAPFDL